MIEIRVSVRKLVEFILRAGDITTGKGGLMDPDAMQEGSRMHRKIQKRMDASYRAEVPLSVTVPFEVDEESAEMIIEGRADGVYYKEDIETYGIDEIKCMYMPVEKLEEAIPVHEAQAKCYAYIYAKENECSQMEVQMTYCCLEDENIKRFSKIYSYEELKNWFLALTKEYEKWMTNQIRWERKRNTTIKELEFPFSYREGQKQLVTGVYQTILRKKRLFIEAPTGVGKTISTVFPTVKAMGEGLIDKVFYLTAKTITRTVAMEAFYTLAESGAKLKVVVLTAKEKICILDKPECNPETCVRAKGHYDRVNDAVFDLLTNEEQVNRELIEEYAKKHCVCPFEMSLDLSLWVDAVVCDYNYVFDPNVYLRRFFEGKVRESYAFLVDEAHNLVERGREMYSAHLVKEQILQVKKIMRERSKKVEKALSQCNKDMLALKRECEECNEVESVDLLALHIMRLMAALEEFLHENGNFSGREEVLNFYFEVRRFFATYELLDSKYVVYSDYTSKGEFQVHLQCMDPSSNLEYCLAKARSAVFFSATLLPVKYYMEQLAGRKEDYAVYAPSPFLEEKRLLLVGMDVSTKYTRRTQEEYERISQYIIAMLRGKTGNYLAFFPSYKMLSDIKECLESQLEDQGLSVQILEQNTVMTEESREAFLSSFEAESTVTKIGLCVLGGIFSEGIDLKEDRLIGTAIVGTGLPMVCNEREIFRRYYDERNGYGFDYSYLYPGMNKVLQAAGRVIRTVTDTGVILLLDERFTTRAYQNVFPREWKSYKRVNILNVQDAIETFWRREEET